jgi:hypothetical protein
MSGSELRGALAILRPQIEQRISAEFRDCDFWGVGLTATMQIL